MTIVASMMALCVKERREFRLCMVLTKMKWRAHRYEYDDAEKKATDARFLQQHCRRCILKLIVA